MVEKTDLKKTLDSFRARHGEFRLLEVPPLPYLMVDGHGDPNAAGGEYAQALAALYPVAYKLKFASKSDGRDYVVPPLEALWWADDMDAFTRSRDKSRWDWTAMIMTPAWVTDQMLEDAKAAAGAKEKPASLDEVRLETLEEGTCVQTLHIGSYDEEGPVLEELHDRFVPEHDLRLTGKHHEVYLSDPRRVEPAKLRTILRQPVTAT